LGGVVGRPASEDEEIALDRLCDNLLERACRAANLRVAIHSEHGARNVGRGTPRYVIATDPFDGSGLFRRGIPAEWWSVLSVYDGYTLKPLAAGAVDVLRGELYLAGPEGATVQAVEGGRPKRVKPSGKTALDNETVIAAYLMDPSYISAWMAQGKGLMDAMLREFPVARIWPNGGSCAYPWLARGTVHVYLMFGEPRSEVDPGLAFARLAGFPVYGVDLTRSDLTPSPFPTREGGLTGRLAEYAFEPGKGSGRVPCLLAACTGEMAEDVARRLG
jgi:fructose-1,6-bisphosphatase/inositol monophosphatase family enzyme